MTWLLLVLLRAMNDAVRILRAYLRKNNYLNRLMSKLLSNCTLGGDRGGWCQARLKATMYSPRGNEGRLIGSRGYFIDCLRWKSVQYLNRRLIGLSKRGEQSVSRDVSLTGFRDRRVLARARGPLESVFLCLSVWGLRLAKCCLSAYCHSICIVSRTGG